MIDRPLSLLHRFRCNSWRRRRKPCSCCGILVAFIFLVSCIANGLVIDQAVSFPAPAVEGHAHGLCAQDGAKHHCSSSETDIYGAFCKHGQCSLRNVLDNIPAAALGCAQLITASAWSLVMTGAKVSTAWALHVCQATPTKSATRASALTQAALRTVNDDNRSDQVITWMLPLAHNCLPGRPNNMCTIAFNAGNAICFD